MQKIAVLGASRGFGRAFIEQVSRVEGSISWLLASRKGELLEFCKQQLEANAQHKVKVCVADFSQAPGQEKVLSAVQEFDADRVFYFAGGGPFGAFGSKKWSDHEWAYQVSLLFPARLANWALQQKQSSSALSQLVIVGSAVAEDQADPFASSYASSKHALLGLHRSISAESPALDFRLYSPGYMDTELLPPNAWPRQQVEQEVLNPEHVAKDLWEWAKTDAIRGYRRYKSSDD